MIVIFLASCVFCESFEGRLERAVWLFMVSNVRFKWNPKDSTHRYLHSCFENQMFVLPFFGVKSVPNFTRSQRIVSDLYNVVFWVTLNFQHPTPQPLPFSSEWYRLSMEATNDYVTCLETITKNLWSLFKTGLSSLKISRKNRHVCWMLGIISANTNDFP